MTTHDYYNNPNIAIQLNAGALGTSIQQAPGRISTNARLPGIFITCLFLNSNYFIKIKTVLSIF
jgi:hypothetical protein